MSAQPCYHEATLAQFESRSSADYSLADARETYVSESLPYLANALLSSPKWLDDAGGHAPVMAAQERTALCFADPCEYGTGVRRALIDLALMQAEEHLQWISQDAQPLNPNNWPRWQDIDPASVA